jgi:heptosyltransferase-1
VTTSEPRAPGPDARLNRILIVRLGSLGDIVHALPAAAALRHAHPRVVIDWLVDRRNLDIVSLVPLVDRPVVLDRPTLGGWVEVIRELRRVRYDVAIDLQGLMKSAVLARASGARRVLGFSIWHLRERSARPFYSETGEPTAGHVIEKNLALVRRLGADTGAWEFPLASTVSPALEQIRRALAPETRFALLNPGAAWPNKRWAPDRFGRVGAFLRERFGLRSVVLWGPGEERLAGEVVSASSGAAVLAPGTSIADLVELSRAATLMIAGDTGPLHIAAAAGTPIVSLFGPTNPARNGPWVAADRILSRHDRCSCHYQRRCRRRDWCLADITVDEVTRAVEERLT